MVIIGSGPNRIGQGIEFDYCCVHAAQSFRALGYEAVMVNCNPETVSTDYDTSDRLYFEPLGAEEVLAVCEREQPEGVVIQFGGQTPLKLARAIEAGGFRILGTPYDAIDLAEDRERFGELLSGLGIRCPEWGIAASGREAAEIAHRIGYPVLVRPSYVLGGRAMRVCYRGNEVVEAFHHDLSGKVLVDRFLENAIEIDVDALCDGEETYVAAVMQHVEEAGVHSGDSACVLPAPSLDVATAREVESVVRRLAPALGTIGLINVQLAVAEDTVYVLEANPRASRTVPFASKATGLRLVEAACRLAAGAKLRELGLPAGAAAEAGLGQGCGAAVLALSRQRSGARPRDALDRRGDGLGARTSRPRSRRRSAPPAGRCPPPARPSCRSGTTTRRRCARWRRRWPGSASSSSRPREPPASCADAGLEVEQVAKVAEGGEATVVDLVRRGRCDLVVNTPFGGSLQRTDGYRIREAALVARIPCITTISGAAAAVHAIANARTELALSLQERIDVETRTANGS